MRTVTGATSWGVETREVEGEGPGEGEGEGVVEVVVPVRVVELTSVKVVKGVIESGIVMVGRGMSTVECSWP